MGGMKQLACAALLALLLHLLLLLIPYPIKRHPETTYPVSTIWLQPPAARSAPAAHVAAATNTSPTTLTKNNSIPLLLPQVAELGAAGAVPTSGEGTKLVTPYEGSANRGEPRVVSKVSRPPFCLRDPKPELPALSRSLGEEGRVTLRLQIGVDGAVHSVVVVKSSTYGRLDEAARKTLLKWRCQPALRHGGAVVAELEETVMFELK